MPAFLPVESLSSETLKAPEGEETGRLMLDRRRARPFVDVALEAGQTAAGVLDALVAEILVADTGADLPVSSPDKSVPTSEGRSCPKCGLRQPQMSSTSPCALKPSQVGATSRRRHCGGSSSRRRARAIALRNVLPLQVSCRRGGAGATVPLCVETLRPQEEAAVHVIVRESSCLRAR